MKYLFTCIILLCTLVANAQDVLGTYQLDRKSKDSTDFKLKRTLILHADGTFEYYNYRYVERGIPKETHTYGRGTWTKDKKVIHFSTDPSELDENYTLDFSGTKARFINKSPRDKSDRVVETSIRLYESEISWIKGMTLIKK